MGEPIFLVPSLVPEEQYQARRVIERTTQENWEESVRSEVEAGAEAPDVTGYIPDAAYLATNSKWRKLPFGAANTMEYSGCLVFVAKHLLDFYGVRTSVLALRDIVVERGYRAWKFEKVPKTFYTPAATLQEALEVLPENVKKEEITKLEDAYPYVGKPSGIGRVHVLLDNLIGYYAKRRPVQETRLLWVQDVYDELKEGRMVPMRVENSRYHHDPMRPGGHFIILVAIQNQEALVIDPSIGEKRLPIHHLLQAATVAWKVCPKR